MPIENEIKFVLDMAFDPAQLAGWSAHDVEQYYLDDGPRIRRFDEVYLFTYKKWIEAEACLVEIEQPISKVDYMRLKTCCTAGLSKTRYKKVIAGEEWVVDFLCDGAGQVYFVMAEVEMAADKTRPHTIPPQVAHATIHAVGHNACDRRFTNKSLTDVAAARQLYHTLKSAS